MNAEIKRRQLEQLRAQVRQLESELGQAGDAGPQWQATGYYAAYHATTGFMLGALAALSSLMLNIIGALVVGKQPLELIRVYLTFPMGEKALDLNAVDNGLILAIGVCLYLATGMLYGILFQIVITRFTTEMSFATRFMVVSTLALAVWLVNFYGILSWLQPLLFGGRWIVDTIPPWVAAATHLVFGWTMLAIYPLGLYTPYRISTEQS